MPNTTRGIYYPDENTLVAPLEAVFAAQAMSMDNALAALETSSAPTTITDTGWSLSGISLATGFTGLSDSQGRTTSVKGGLRMWGPLVEARFRVTKGTGTITANASGNIGDVLIATITNAAMRPAGTVYAQFDYGPGLGSGALRIGTDGTVVLTDFYPNGTIIAGNQIQADAMFFTG